MVDPIKIGPLTGSESAGGVSKPQSGDKGTDVSFKDILAKSLQEVSELQNTADETIQKFAAGEVKNIEEVMIAMEEANMAFEMTMQVRNRIIQAYQEIMRMQV